MNKTRIALSTLLTLLLFGSGLVQVRADDTDIYLAPPTVARDDAPNILIILDNSGSMESNTVTINQPYDATNTYAGDSTKTNGYIFDTSKIYWTDDGSIPSDADSTSNLQWFSASNNNCSHAANNLGTSAGATGIYSSDYIAEYHPAPTKNWGNVAAGLDDLVECAADSQTYGGSDTLYADSTKNNNYTSSSSLEISWTAYGGITLYSGNYLNYYWGPKTTITQTRMETAKDAVTQIVNSNINVRLGLMVYNNNNSNPNGGRVVARISKLTDPWRTSLKNTLAEVRGYVNPGASYGSGSRPNYTPLAETLWEAKQYFSGGSVTYGGSNWDTGNSGSDVKYPRPYPDVCAEDASNSAYCADYNYGSIDRTNVDSWYTSTGGTYISPFKYQCQQAYVIVITDGDPTNDGAANSNIDNLPGIIAYPTPNSTGSSTATTAGTSDRLDDLAGWMYNNDIIPNATLDGTQRVLTYTVGFGTGLSTSGRDLLKRTAEAGHGQYFNASDANKLASSLQSAIIDIQTTSSSFAAPSLSVNAFNKLYNSDDIYFALFKPSGTVAWDGNIKKLHLCNTSDVANYGCTYGEIIDSQTPPQPAIDTANLRIKKTSQSYWSSSADGGTVTAGGAGEAIENQSGARNIYTFMGDYTTGLPSSGTKIDNSTSGAMYTAATADYSLLDSTGTIAALPTTTEQNTAVESTLDWMTGYDFGSTTNKRWPMGDPLHSRPVALTLGKDSTTGKPIIKLLVATNDGQIHMIDDSTGEEQWAFIPQELLGKQYSLALDGDGTHPYGADSTPVLWVQDTDGNGIIDPSKGEDIWMFIGMRRGGRNIYAFDMLPSSSYSTPITSTSTIIKPELKWVIQGGTTTGFTQLGQTWSVPQLVNIRMKCNGGSCTAGDSVAKTVLIFGGGYNKGQDSGNFATSSSSPFGTDNAASPAGMGNGIYIVDPTDGSLIWRAGSDASADLQLSDMIYSIPSEVALTDTNGDFAADRMYVGDMGGQVWRIDLDNQLDVGSNGASTGYVFADLVCQRNASNVRDCSNTTFNTPEDWRKLFYPPDISQVSDSTYSNTPNYDVVAFATGNRADPVDWQTINSNKEAVHNYIYALRDYNIGTGGAPSGTVAITGPDLEDVTANILDTGTAAQVTTKTNALKTSKGWFIELKEATAIKVVPVAPSTTVWVGEKGLAKAVIFDNVIYVTTYTPANEVTSTVTCAANEGLGKLYTLNLVNATGVNGVRVQNVGGGIPSELVTIIRPGGITGLVGTSGGAAGVDLPGWSDKKPVYWYQK
ncbi:MAG: PilC/PilY family type IV pilus protein [Acidiferrobacteraceae bacterium]